MPAAGSDGDGLCIELRGMRVMGTHGVLPHERSAPQPFSVDLDVRLAAGVGRGAATSDDLAETVDYAELVDVVGAVVAGPSLALLEALADRVADAVLGTDPRIEAVAVTVRKLRPPVPVHLDSVGVRLTRARQSPSS